MHDIGRSVFTTRTYKGLALCAAMLGCALGAWSANAQDPCAQWVAKRGYAHDYAEQRTGFRPPTADKWSNNVHRDDLDVDDAVMLKSMPGHVAMIDEVERDAAGKIKALKVSDFNYRAKSSEAWQDEKCKVSTNFGKASKRTITMGEVAGQWRAPKSRRY